MPTPVEVNKESTNIAHEAELGTPKNLENVHKELQQDMKNYSAADYGKLLNGIQTQNQSDVAANDHLPSLSFYDSGKAGVPDSVAAQYSDGTLKTAEPHFGGSAGAAAGAGGQEGASGMSGHPGGHNQGFDHINNSAPPPGDGRGNNQTGP